MSRRSPPILLLLLFWLLPLPAFAQFARSICSDPSQSMLWELQSAALDQRNVQIHLLGSIHVGKAGFYPLHPEVEQRFRAADHLVFEVDPQAVASPQVAKQMQLRGMLPQGQTLQDVLSPETLGSLEQVLRGIGIPLANFMQFKPWMVALLLTNLQAEALGYDSHFGLESYLAGQRPSDADILELESLEQQLGMLETLHPDTFLGYSLHEYAGGSALMESMVAAWLCGDKQTLEDIVHQGEAQLEAAAPAQRAHLEQIHDSLFTRRNLSMADGIEAFAEAGQGSYFVVVGAGHLLGAGSVVELLQQRGYEVAPVLLAP
ncbi:MAG: TraB/GumN family protein [Pseudohongiellaceae bacterium]